MKTHQLPFLFHNKLLTKANRTICACSPTTEHKAADTVLTSGVLQSQVQPCGDKALNLPQFPHLSNKAPLARPNLSLDVQQPSENPYKEKEQGPNCHRWKQEGRKPTIKDGLTLQQGS